MLRIISPGGNYCDYWQDEDDGLLFLVIDGMVGDQLAGWEFYSDVESALKNGARLEVVPDPMFPDPEEDEDEGS